MNEDFKNQLKNLIQNQIFENTDVVKFVYLKFINNETIECKISQLELVGKTENVLKYTRISEKYNYLENPPTLITYFNLNKISSFTILIKGK